MVGYEWGFGLLGTLSLCEGRKELRRRDADSFLFLAFSIQRGNPPPLLSHPSPSQTLPLPQPYRLLLLASTPLPPNFSNLIYPDSDTNSEIDSFGYRIAMRIGGKNGHALWRNEKFLDVEFEEEVECEGLPGMMERETCEELKERLPLRMEKESGRATTGEKFVLVLDGESPEEAFLDGR